MIPHIAVILTDTKRRILWVNEDFTEITGYSLPEVFGKKPGDLLQGKETNQDAVLRMRKCLDQKIPFKEEVTNYRRNGEAYQCKLVVYPVFNIDHVLTNYIAFEVDGGEVPDEENLPLMRLQERYSSSSLRGIDEVKLFYQLQELMQTCKLYLDPYLTLKSVADRLNTNTKYLSQVVNHQARCNFQQFINTYRVNEAKKMILNPNTQNLTLFGIALNCGFKNKSTFYKVFKDLTDLTPKEFLKNKYNGVH